jgi:type III secretory pathway component EscV
MKLRRGTEQDLEDCLNVALTNHLSVEELDKHFEDAIRNSIKDTTIFNFRLIYNHFRQALMELLYQKSKRTPDDTQG